MEPGGPNEQRLEVATAGGALPEREPSRPLTAPGAGGAAIVAVAGLPPPLAPDEQARAAAQHTASAQRTEQPWQHEWASSTDEARAAQDGQQLSSGTRLVAAVEAASQHVKPADAAELHDGQDLDTAEPVASAAVSEPTEAAALEEAPAKDAADGLQPPVCSQPAAELSAAAPDDHTAAAPDEPTAAALVEATAAVSADPTMARGGEPTAAVPDDRTMAAARGGPTAPASKPPAQASSASALECPAEAAQAADPPAVQPAAVALETAAGLASGLEVAGGADSAAAGKKKHHLLRHELTEEAQAAAAAHLGAATAEEAAENIWKLKQRELQDMFAKVYGKPTNSCNNDWMRGKLLQAVGLDARWRPESMQLPPRPPVLPHADGEAADDGAVSRYGRRRRAAAMMKVYTEGDEEEDEEKPSAAEQPRRRAAHKPVTKLGSGPHKRARLAESMPAQTSEQPAAAHAATVQPAAGTAQTVKQEAPAPSTGPTAAALASDGLLPVSALGPERGDPFASLRLDSGAANGRLLAAMAAAGSQPDSLLQRLQAAVQGSQRAWQLPGAPQLASAPGDPGLLAAAGAAAAALAAQQTPLQAALQQAAGGLSAIDGGLTAAGIEASWAGLAAAGPLSSGSLLALSGALPQSLPPLAGLPGGLSGGFASTISSALGAAAGGAPPPQLGGLPWPLLSAIRERAGMRLDAPQQAQAPQVGQQDAAPAAAAAPPLASMAAALPAELQQRLQAMQAAHVAAQTGGAPPGLSGTLWRPGGASASAAFNPFNPAAAQAAAAAAAAAGPSPQQLQLQQLQHQQVQLQQLQGLAGNLSAGLGPLPLGSAMLSGPVPLYAVPSMHGTLSSDLHSLYNAWQDGKISFLDP